MDFVFCISNTFEKCICILHLKLILEVFYRTLHTVTGSMLIDYNITALWIYAFMEVCNTYNMMRSLLQQCP